MDTTPSSSSPIAATDSLSVARPPTTTLAATAATRCRYKTGRCMNTRVAKPNGTLLLLCELHRDQQNRTKKRSDLKYRHDRSKKRKAAGYNNKSQLFTVTSMPTPTSAAMLSPPLLSTPNGSMCTTDTLKRTALYKLSSGLRSAAIGCQISPGKARISALRTRSFDGGFQVHRRDIVAMASPHKLHTMPSTPTFSGAASLASIACPLAVPPCLSPIPQNSPWLWQPEDVRILEYFIL